MSGAAPEEDIAQEVLFEDSLVVVASLKNPWARRRKINLAELHAEPWIIGPSNTANYLHIAEAFRAIDLAMPRVALETHSVSLLRLDQPSMSFARLPPMTLTFSTSGDCSRRKRFVPSVG